MPQHTATRPSKPSVAFSSSRPEPEDSYTALPPRRHRLNPSSDPAAHGSPQKPKSRKPSFFSSGSKDHKSSNPLRRASSPLDHHHHAPSSPSESNVSDSIPSNRRPSFSRRFSKLLWNRSSDPGPSTPGSTMKKNKQKRNEKESTSNISEVPVVVDHAGRDRIFFRLAGIIRHAPDMPAISEITDLINTDGIKDIHEDDFHLNHHEKLASKKAMKAALPPVIFGVALRKVYYRATVPVLMGGVQQHKIPIALFMPIEHLVSRGISSKYLFKVPLDPMAEKPESVRKLIDFFSLAPQYGDSEVSPVGEATVSDLSHLLLEYLRALPEPLLESSVFRALTVTCVLPWLSTLQQSRMLSPKRDMMGVMCAKLLFRLLPTAHFGPMAYVLSFLAAVPNHPQRRNERCSYTSFEYIAEVFGSAICGPRDPLRYLLSHGFFDLEEEIKPSKRQVEEAKKYLNYLEQATLLWLIVHWTKIYDGLLEDDFETDLSRCGVDEDDFETDKLWWETFDLPSGSPLSDGSDGEEGEGDVGDNGGASAKDIFATSYSMVNK